MQGNMKYFDTGYNLMNKVRKAHHDLKFELTLGKRLESNLHFYFKIKQVNSLTQRISAMNREL